MAKKPGGKHDHDRDDDEAQKPGKHNDPHPPEHERDPDFVEHEHAREREGRGDLALREHDGELMEREGEAKDSATQLVLMTGGNPLTVTAANPQPPTNISYVSTGFAASGRNRSTAAPRQRCRATAPVSGRRRQVRQSTRAVRPRTRAR